jgi:hypothetical protein
MAAVNVPNAWISATPSLRKRCKSIKGTAGHKRLRLIAERQGDKKVINSKVTYLQGSRQTQASVPDFSIPAQVLPTSSSSESNDDDFVDVHVRMASWIAPVLSVLTQGSSMPSASQPTAAPAVRSPTRPCRKLACPRGRLLRNCLRDVEVARPSPRSFNSPKKFDGFLVRPSRAHSSGDALEWSKH